MIKQRPVGELRSSDRIPLFSKLSYSFFVGGKLEEIGGDAHLRDMSASGVGFEPDDRKFEQRLALGAGLQLRIDWDSKDDTTLVIKGRIVRLNEALVAVEISHYGWESKRPPRVQPDGESVLV